MDLSSVLRLHLYLKQNVCMGVCVRYVCSLEKQKACARPQVSHHE